MAAGASILVAAACSNLGNDKYDETRDWSAEKLYAEAKDELTAGSYRKAIGYYEKLQARFPYGKFALQGDLEIAYAYYKDKDNVGALAAADRFIKLHPNHPAVDYAYYLKGLVNFNGEIGILAKFVPQDMSERDPKAAQESFDAFKELVRRFPQSKYAPDAVLRMRYLVNLLASNEVRVAEYYLRRQAYVAAVARAKQVIVTYPQAPAVEQALEVLVKGYDALGLADLRDDAQRLLKLNYPDAAAHLAQAPAAAPAPAEHKWWKFW